MTNYDPSINYKTLRVLLSFLKHPRDKLSSIDICNETNMLSGTLYTILIQLEKSGWLESRFEERDRGEANRPRKRVYWLTRLGDRKARKAFSDLEIDIDGPAAGTRNSDGNPQNRIRPTRNAAPLG